MPPSLPCPPAFAREGRIDLSAVLPVLLAGGRGSRLHELTATECKPAIPLMTLAGRKVRMVDFTLANLARSGLTRLLVATQYRPLTLAAHLRNDWATQFSPLHLRDGRAVTDRGYRGRGHAVAANRDLIDGERPQELLILSGDHVYEMDYSAMIAAHRASGAAITVAVTHVPLTRARAFGVIEADGSGAITGFFEKPGRPQTSRDDPAAALVSMGVYVADWRWLRATLVRQGPQADFGHDVLPAAVRMGGAQSYPMPTGAAQAGPYWRDVGSLDALRETVRDLTNYPPPCTLAIPGLEVAGHIGQGGYEAFQYSFACASGGMTLQAPRLGAPLGRRWTVMEESVVLPGGRVMPGARLTRVLVAPGTAVPAGLVVGEDPDEDARWFRRSEGGTVLVTAAMLARRAALRERPPLFLPGWRKAGPLQPVQG